MDVIQPSRTLHGLAAQLLDPLGVGCRESGRWGLGWAQWPLQENGRDWGRLACKWSGLRAVETQTITVWGKTQWLRCLVMMVVRPVQAVIVQMQRWIALVVVWVGCVLRCSLGMHPGVGDVGAQLRLTQRREPQQRLPQQGKHQKGGAGAWGHGKAF